MRTPRTQTNLLSLPQCLVGVPISHEHSLQRKLRIYLVLRMFPVSQLRLESGQEGRPWLLFVVKLRIVFCRNFNEFNLTIAACDELITIAWRSISVNFGLNVRARNYPSALGELSSNNN